MVETEQEILKRQIAHTNTGVPMRKSRFPQEGGVEQKVTLISRLSGTFKNCAFKKGVENTLSGNIADLLLNSYPGQFMVKKVNGVPYTADAVSMEYKIRSDIITQLKEEFDLVRKTPKSTSRTAHSEPIKNNNSNAYSTSINKNTIPPKIKK